MSHIELYFGRFKGHLFQGILFDYLFYILNKEKRYSEDLIFSNILSFYQKVKTQKYKPTSRRL